MPLEVHSIELDQTRVVRWTMRADARLSSIDTTLAETIRGLRSKRRQLYSVCCLLWAALRTENPFSRPEDLAEYLDTGKKQLDAMKVIQLMLEEAGYLKSAKKKPRLSGST